MAVIGGDSNLRNNDWDLWPEQPDTGQVSITEAGSTVSGAVQLHVLQAEK